MDKSNPRISMLLFLLPICLPAFSQDPTHPGVPPSDPKFESARRLPNGKLQSEEILKADHEKSLQDLKQIVEISQSLSAEMERNTSQVLSLSSIKKAKELEKLAKRVRDRMSRYQ